MANTEFIDFSYGGQKASDFHLYRVSDGSRYNDNLIPTLTDKTAETPGADGMYFFNTCYKQRQFSINFAYDALTATDLRNIRNWLNGKEVKALIFDEKPDRQYFAKVTGSPSFKYIAFDQPVELGESSNTTASGTDASEETQVIMKGEGSVQFTCYDPYAYSITTTEQVLTVGTGYEPATVSVGGTAPTPFKVESIYGLSSGNTIEIRDNANSVLYFITLKEATDATNAFFEWNSATGMVKARVDGIIRPIKFSGKAMGVLEPDTIPRITTMNVGGGTALNLSFKDRYI